MDTNEQISLYNQSLDYLQGNGVPVDVEKSFALNARAARAGYREAVLAMGWFYLGGGDYPIDYEKAKQWYRKAARHGDPKAMFSLGRIAYAERDFAESLRYFSRAAESGYARSLYWVGKHHWYGRSVAKGRKAAISFFHLAAAKKVVAAQRVLKFLSRRDYEKSNA